MAILTSRYVDTLGLPTYKIVCIAQICVLRYTINSLKGVTDVLITDNLN